MAKPRKTYKKRPFWYYLIIYLVIGAIIYGVLIYSGLLKLNGVNYGESPETSQEIEYFE